MISSLIITFRETLEIALIVGIILSYLAKTKQSKYNNVVYLGIVSGIVASIIGAFLFLKLFGQFEGFSEQIFEGITTLIGAVLLTTMILWMLKQKNVASELQQKVSKKIAEAKKLGLFILVFVSVLREGIETVIFLSAASFVSKENNLFGAFLGIIAAIILGYLIFVGSKKINIKKFFNITSILLILFAAGLIAHSAHEFEEAKILPPLIDSVWNLNPEAPRAAEGIYPLLHEEGYIGSILKSLFGYRASPSLIEVLVYLSYIIIVIILWRKIEKNKLKLNFYNNI